MEEEKTQENKQEKKEEKTESKKENTVEEKSGVERLEFTETTPLNIYNIRRFGQKINR